MLSEKSSIMSYDFMPGWQIRHVVLPTMYHQQPSAVPAYQRSWPGYNAHCPPIESTGRAGSSSHAPGSTRRRLVANLSRQPRILYGRIVVQRVVCLLRMGPDRV